VQLKVSDDGCGFDPTKIVRGYGIAAMRSRVTEAGGTVVVDSTPAGTTIRVEIRA